MHPGTDSRVKRKMNRGAIPTSKTAGTAMRDVLLVTTPTPLVTKKTAARAEPLGRPSSLLSRPHSLQTRDVFSLGLGEAEANLLESNSKDRLPHSTKKIARVGACPDRPHLRCVTRKPVGPQYGITLLAAEGPDGVDEGIGVGADLCQVDPLVGRVHPAARRTAHHGGNTGGFPQG